MTEGWVVSIDFLRDVTTRLLDLVQAGTGGEIVLNEDMFWAIEADSLYDVYQEPSSFTIGQLTESYENLQEIVEGARPEIAYGLVWLSDVLRAIALQVKS